MHVVFFAIMLFVSNEMLVCCFQCNVSVVCNAWYLCFHSVHASKLWIEKNTKFCPSTKIVGNLITKINLNYDTRVNWVQKFIK